MQRSRTRPPSDSSETGVASLPQGLPPLEVLLQQARAPDAARAEVDALIAGLAQPLAADQSPRERADLLLALIEDKHLGDFSGSRGLTVRSAAVQALLALGYPYALEVPPDALEAHPASEREAGAAAPQSLFSSTKGLIGLCLITVLGLAQLIPALYFASSTSYYDSDFSAEMWIFGLVGGTTFFPTLLVVLGHLKRSRFFRGMGNLLLTLASLLWLLPGAFVLTQTPAGLIPVAVGILFIVSITLMESAVPPEPK